MALVELTSKNQLELITQTKFRLLASSFKCIAIRSDKADTSFAAMIHLAAAVINSR